MTTGKHVRRARHAQAKSPHMLRLIMWLNLHIRRDPIKKHTVGPLQVRILIICNCSG